MHFARGKSGGTVKGEPPKQEGKNMVSPSVDREEKEGLEEIRPAFPFNSHQRAR